VNAIETARMTTSDRRWTAALAVLLVGMTAALFWPVRTFEFVRYDDPYYVVDNHRVSGGLSLSHAAWAFSNGLSGSWQPLTWLSLMLDAEIGGPDARVFHLSNLAIHTLNVVLVFLLLKRMTGAVGMSAFTAALFAIHPLHVEPVAWISERKGLLSTMFGLLAIGAYVRYTRALSKRWLFAALLAYLASLMSKQMLVTLPFVLLLLDYWPLKRLTFGPADSCDPQTSTEAGKPPANATGSCAERLQSPAQPVRRLIWEKLPFFVVGFSFCVVAFAVQNAAGAVGTLDKYPLGVRLSNAVFSYGAYFAKTFIPTSLAVYYPHPGQAPPGGQILGAVLLLLAVSALAVFQRRKHPYLLVGWLWYLGTLLPVIGLVQIGTHQMAIRYTYVPILGLFIAVTWLVESLLPSGRRRRPLTILLVIVPIVACAVVSSQELTHWRSTQSLFTHALGVAEDNPLTRNHLGNVLAREGRPRDAIYHYQKALQIDPEDLDTHINYGVALYELGLWDAAIVHYQKALGISPDSAAAHNHLGNAEYARGRRDAAAHHYRTAFELDPNLAVPRNNLGNLLREEGRFAEAVESFLEALALQPYYVDAHNNLGLTYQAAGEFDKAIEH
jgi:tetratricopeptide (TPR) repeat protein